MICPAGRNVTAPCPRKVYTGEYNACLPCIESWRERAAILEYGQGTGDNPESPTCQSRSDAEALASQMLREELQKQLDRGGGT